jgi:hypothetical protein
VQGTLFAVLEPRTPALKPDPVSERSSREVVTMFRFNLYSRLAPVALASVLAVGCSELPTQPVIDSNPSGVQALVPSSAAASVSASAKIKGQDGGTVSAGIFTVVIPPGAFPGQGTVTVSQPDPAQPVAVLSIFPIDKNVFLVPVTLTATLPALEVGQLLQSSMSEQDTLGMWHPMDSSQADSQTMTVSASLVHFSTYRVDIAAPASGGVSGTGATRPVRTAKETD